MVEYEYVGRFHSFRTAGNDHGPPDGVSDEEEAPHPPPSYLDH